MQSPQPLGPFWRDLLLCNTGQAHQRFVHFIRPLGRGPGLLAYPGDRLGIQCAEIVGTLRVAPAAVEHRLGAAFFQWRVIEKGVGARAENFGGHRRGRGQVAADHAHVACFHASQQGQPAFAVHGFVQAVIEGLFHQRVVGHFALAGEVFQAGNLVGKHTGDQVFAFHALDLRRHLAPAGVARQCQGHAGVPAPAHAEQRRIQHGLDQQVFGAVAVEVAPHVIQREAVTGGQRQHNRIFAGRRLQLEVEGAAKALAQGQAPGAVDTAAKGRVDDQLGAPGRVEKPLHDQGVLRRQGAEGQARAGQVIQQLFGAGAVQAEGVGEPRLRRLQVTGAGAEQVVQLPLQTGHRRRQLVAAPRRFAYPERNGRRLTVGVLDAHLAGVHPQDAVGRIAELENIAGDAFHRKVFVDAADVQALGLEQHAVVGVVGDGAAAGHGREPGATAAAQGVSHGVPMQISAAHALAAVVAVGEHVQQRLVMALVQRGIGRGAADKRQQGSFRPFARADLGDDLLGQHVQRRHGDVQGVELATAHAVEEGGAFDQVVAGGGKQAALGRTADLVPGAADPLQKPVDRAGRADLADQVHIADINAQLQRRGGDQHLQRTGLEALLGVQAHFLGQAAVVGGHRRLAQTLAQMPRQAFGQAPGVHEYQRGAVFARQLGEAVVDQLPHIIGHHRGERHWRHFDSQVARAGGADVDNGALAAATDQKPRHRIDRLLRGRQADARQRLGAQGLQALQA
ncbi:hypothetical protein [Pseudomonas sp. 24 E 13]|nr:hypothetical protein [Pseudomonas sp. 24 E 13]